MPRQKTENRRLDLNKQARELLLNEMEKRGMTKRDLANKLNCTYESVQQVLTGFRAMNITTLERYAHAIGFDVRLVPKCRRE